MGFIALKGIEVYGRVGVLPQERLMGRKFMVDVRVKYPLQEAGKTDEIADAFNYETLAKAVFETFAMEYKLMEAACRGIADKILGMHKNIESIKITMHKVSPFINGHIGAAEVEWQYPEDW